MGTIFVIRPTEPGHELPTDLTIRVRARTRGMWWLQVGAWFIRVGARLLEQCRAEVQIDGGKWEPIVATKVTRLHVQIADSNEV